MLIIALVIIAAAGGAGIYYFYNKYQTLKHNPNAAVKEETDKLVSEVGKLMELPKDETPTIATVVDKEKIKDQVFFVNSENGDKVLAYTKAQKAILYRPSIKKIINVAPIYINDQASPSPSPSPSNESKKSTN